MTTAMSLGLLFIAKMADNALSTVKTIMIQRNRSLLAGVAIALSSFLYFWITRSVVLADSLLTTLTVAEPVVLAAFWSAASTTSYPRIAPMSMW